MSEQVTLKQVGVDLRKMGEDGQWSWTLVPFADAIDAHLAQHAAMVLKLRELSARLYGQKSDDSAFQNGVIAGYEEVGFALDFIINIASPEPAEPVQE